MRHASIICYTVQEIQSLPLVKGTHECQQEISKTGILQKSICEELHVLRPFSRDSSGAVTKTVQSLKYVTERTSSSSSGIYLISLELIMKLLGKIRRLNSFVIFKFIIGINVNVCGL